MAVSYRWVVAIVGLFAVAPVLADSPAPPRSYRRVAPEGKFVFVMLVSGPVEENVQRLNEERAADIREIHRVYPRSGMYRNDGSAEPLWTVDWYSFSVELMSDGVHLIRPGPWAWLREDRTPDYDVEAVSFFANGRLLRTYTVGELVDDPSHLELSVSHYLWCQKVGRSGEFEYTIKTLDGNQFVFNVRTGEIVSSTRMGLVFRWSWWVALVLVAVAGSVWYPWRRSRKQPAQATV